MTTRSPLRYPGGKSKALAQIAARLYVRGPQYGMNNFGRNFAPKGWELFITDYPARARGARREDEYVA